MRLVPLVLTLIVGASAMAADPVATAAKTAMFAGGCFWCMQPVFDNTPGVISTRVGYAGGAAKTATYEQVSTGKTGHAEVIEITYDAHKISYRTLVDLYLTGIDPTQADGQFADRGPQYQTAIYYANETEKAAAQKALADIAPKFAPAPVVVALRPATPFYAAEEHHQNYYLKNKQHYNAYKIGSGRAGFIEKHWKK